VNASSPYPLTLIDALAVEVSLYWPVPASVAEERHALVQRALRKDGLRILTAISDAIDKEVRERRSLGLRDAENPGLSTEPFRQMEQIMQTPPPGLRVQVKTPAPRRGLQPRHWVEIFLSAMLLGMILFQVLKPAERVAHLAYRYTNPNGCRVYEGKNGDIKGRAYVICPRAR
jgi:hypothetical protein